MVLVRNNKPSTVGLPHKDGRTIQFASGTHDYEESDLDLNTSSKAVRAYLDGDEPVIEMVGDGGEPDPTPTAKVNASDLKQQIADSDDMDFLKGILHSDDRTTVIAAADKRLAELHAGAANPDTGSALPPTPPTE